MRDLEGRVAVITGGGSGIGEGLAHACHDAGMRVVVADIEAAQAARVASAIAEAGGEAVAVRTDVADRASVEALAERAYEEFGAVHLLFNNAGVLRYATAVDSTDDDWLWTLSVNLLGPLHGAQAFVPRMREQSGGAHIVNTASIAGLIGIATLAAYTASKFGVVGLSEVLRDELAADGIGISVVCPGAVDTQIFAAERNRPERFGGPIAGPGDNQSTAFERMTPRDAAARVLDAVREDRFYIFTHPDLRERYVARSEGILADFDAAAHGVSVR